MRRFAKIRIKIWVQRELCLFLCVFPELGAELVEYYIIKHYYIIKLGFIGFGRKQRVAFYGAE